MVLTYTHWLWSSVLPWVWQEVMEVAGSNGGPGEAGSRQAEGPGENEGPIGDCQLLA